MVITMTTDHSHDDAEDLKDEHDEWEEEDNGNMSC